MAEVLLWPQEKNEMKKRIPATIALILFAGCIGNRQARFIKNPVDTIVRDMPADRVFSIILHDMNVEGNFSEHFYHQYRIIEEKEPGRPNEHITQWMEVGKHYFGQHQEDMGMTLASRGEDGKLVKSVSPPGYNNYVGNEKYGQWRTHREGYSFWEFYGQYAFISTLFNTFSYPVRRSYYNDYRGNYYGRGRSYYGPRAAGGSRYYGTNSAYNRNSRRTASAWSQNRSNFKNRVNRRTRRSSPSKTSRSSSRYRGSGYRSRGGGFGK